MDDLYKWIVVLSVVQAVNSACEVVLEENVNLRVVFETNLEDKRDAISEKMKVEVLLPTEEEPVLSFDLELDRNNDTCIFREANVTSTNLSRKCIYRDNHVNIVLYQMSQNSYLIEGAVVIGSQFWNLYIVEDKNGPSMQLLSLTVCRDDRNANVGFLKTDNTDAKAMIKNLDTSDKRDRNKRSTNVHTVELLMVIDNAIYSWWKLLRSSQSENTESDIVTDIQQYYAYVLKEIDNRFVNMEQELFEINIAFSGMIITKTDEESFWTTTSIVEGDGDTQRIMVNSSEALEKFQQWLDNSTDLPNYDHAILFTGSDLIYAGNPGNTGLAFEASMCRNISNSSIVEEAFDSRTVTYAVRQIARSLGVRDDMDNNDCLEFFNFIMAPKFKLPIKSFSTNRWLFSTCSVQYFKEYSDSLNEVGLNCLQEMSLQERFPIDLTKRVENLPGKFYSAKEQCINKFGMGSDICREEIGKEYSKLCSGLKCTVPGSEVCGIILPADGTPCGNMKYCLGGDCAEFEDAEKSLDTCVFGNKPGEKCEKHIFEFPFLCYNRTLNYKCCMSCAARQTGLPECEYGDRMHGCSIEECSSQTEAYTESECCATCYDGAISYSPPIANFITSMISKASSYGDSTLKLTAPTRAFSSSIAQYSSSPKYSFGSSSTNKLSSNGPFSRTSSVTDTSLKDKRNNFGSSDAFTSLSFSKTKQPTLLTSTLSDESHVAPSDRYSFPYTELVMTKAQPDRLKYENDKGNSGMSTAATTQNKKQDSETNPTEKPPGSTVECITMNKRKAESEQSGIVTTPVPTTQPYVHSKAAPTTTSKLVNEHRQASSRQHKGGNMDIYNRIFFKELARSMRKDQRVIRQRVKQAIKFLYTSVSRRIGNYQETEGENEMTHATNLMGEIPSNDDDDLNRQLKPLWLIQYRNMVRDLETNIKRMRYKVLMMVNRHLRQ